MISAKEKALELFERMSVIHYYKLGGKNAKSKGLPVSMHKSQIIQCSLNCVDEIITVLSNVHYRTDVNDILDLWQNVKKELKKI